MVFILDNRRRTIWSNLPVLVIFASFLHSSYTTQAKAAQNTTGLHHESTNPDSPCTSYTDGITLSYDSLLNFVKSISDTQSKFQIYKALYHEMTNKGNHNVWQMLKLHKSIKEEVLHRENDKDKIIEAQSFFNSFWNPILRKELVKKIFLSIFYDGVRVELRESECFQFIVEIYGEVIEQLRNESTIGAIFANARSKAISLDEQIAIHVAAFHKMRQHNDSTSNNWIALARDIKLTMDDASYELVSSEIRSAHEEIKSKLPRSLKNIVFSKVICIKNAKFNETIFASKDLLPNNTNRRYAFTDILSDEPTYIYRNQYNWRVIFVNDYQIELRNAQFNQTLYADDYVSSTGQSSNQGRDVYVRNESNQICNHLACYWNIALHDDFVLFENAYYKKEALFADMKIKYSKGRYEARRILSYISDKIDEESTKWDIIDCSKLPITNLKKN